VATVTSRRGEKHCGLRISDCGLNGQTANGKRQGPRRDAVRAATGRSRSRSLPWHVPRRRPNGNGGRKGL
jgi:hypothetical protein